MTEPTDGFEAVDAYISDLFSPEDGALMGAMDAAKENGWPEIHVSAPQGKFLYLMAKLIGAKRILEVGTFAGYSGTWLARALPEGGKLVTLELLKVQQRVAQSTFERAGLTEKVQIRQGRAMKVLGDMRDEGEPLFDMVFLDANKDQYPDYLEIITPMLRSGALFLGDNVVRNGAVLDPQDPGAKGANAFNRLLAEHPDYEAVVLQQIGFKGWDGLAVARKI